MLKHNIDVARGSGATHQISSSNQKPNTPNLKDTAATIAAVAAAAALLDVALIPGLVLGGATVLAPKYLPKLFKLRQLLGASSRRSASPVFSSPGKAVKRVSDFGPASNVGFPQAALPKLAIGQALVKTITFRIIVTTLDFSANYLIIGELATAAGLSGFSLVVGPFFYFVHETGWNYFSASAEHKSGRWGDAIELPFALPFRPRATPRLSPPKVFTINLALAKTITFRTFATTMDFTVNYVVVGEVATAAALSAFGFFIGPFVYLGHEMIWNQYNAQKPLALNPLTPMIPASSLA